MQDWQNSDLSRRRRTFGRTFALSSIRQKNDAVKEKIFREISLESSPNLLASLDTGFPVTYTTNKLC